MPERSTVHTQVYDMDYFSGAQMFLYVGDVRVDEITSLNYVTHQQKNPIYGYASQLFDATAAGHVLVQGEFTINFKEQGYLWAVLRRYKKFTEAATGIQNSGDKKRDRFLLNNQLRGPVLKSNDTFTTYSTIEQLTQGKVSKSQRSKLYRDLAGYATFDVNSPRDKTFEDIAEIFEDQIWEKSNSSLNSQIRRTDDNQFDDFDMYVVFGNYGNPRANHTVQKILGVRLTSQGKSIQISGAPIQEAYSFHARSVV